MHVYTYIDVAQVTVHRTIVTIRKINHKVITGKAQTKKNKKQTTIKNDVIKKLVMDREKDNEEEQIFQKV